MRVGELPWKSHEVYLRVIELPWENDESYRIISGDTENYRVTSEER